MPLRRDDVHVIIKTSIRQYMHIVPKSVSCVCAPQCLKHTAKASVGNVLWLFVTIFLQVILGL